MLYVNLTWNSAAPIKFVFNKLIGLWNYEDERPKMKAAVFSIKRNHSLTSRVETDLKCVCHWRNKPLSRRVRHCPKQPFSGSCFHDHEIALLFFLWEPDFQSQCLIFEVFSIFWFGLGFTMWCNIFLNDLTKVKLLKLDEYGRKPLKILKLCKKRAQTTDNFNPIC